MSNVKPQPESQADHAADIPETEAHCIKAGAPAERPETD
jgi:hypothetical protein